MILFVAERCCSTCGCGWPSRVFFLLIFSRLLIFFSDQFRFSDCASRINVSGEVVVVVSQEIEVRPKFTENPFCPRMDLYIDLRLCAAQHFKANEAEKYNAQSNLRTLPGRFFSSRISQFFSAVGKWNYPDPNKIHGKTE